MEFRWERVNQSDGAGEGCGLIGSNNCLPTFAAAIRARHITILAEYYKGCDLAEVFTV